MLGRFLEFSIATPDIRASLDFYLRLGFSQAEVGEAWPHPYAVVTDGRVCLGLHQEPAASPSAPSPPSSPPPFPSMTFVKPDLLRNLAALETRGIEFEFRRLGDHVFNELGWRDPSGELIRLIEARTFSPSKRPSTDTSRCGYFTEIALPTPRLEESKTFWEGLGFIAMDEPDDRLPHVSCMSDHIDLGLYDPAHVRRATLRFEVDDVAGSVARLAQAGMPANGEIPAPLRGGRGAVLIAPEGTALLLCAAG